MLIELMIIVKPGNDDSVNFLESTPKPSPFQFGVASAMNSVRCQRRMVFISRTGSWHVEVFRAVTVFVPLPFSPLCSGLFE